MLEFLDPITHHCLSPSTITLRTHLYGLHGIACTSINYGRVYDIGLSTSPAAYPVIALTLEDDQIYVLCDNYKIYMLQADRCSIAPSWSCAMCREYNYTRKERCPSHRIGAPCQYRLRRPRVVISPLQWLAET